MKTCPACGKQYPDDSLNYCLEDGAQLLSPPAPQAATLVIDGQTTTRPIVDPSWNLPQQQQQQKRRSSKAILWVLGILVVMILLCGGGIGGFLLFKARMPQTVANTGGPDPSPDVGTPPPTTNKAVKPGAVSKQQYDRIKVGMTQSDVEGIMGSRGKDIFNSEGGGISFLLLQWSDENFNTILVNFENNKVSSKSQVGLDTDE